MASQNSPVWLPIRPLVSIAAELPKIQYQIKTLVVNAQATIETRGTSFRVRASAKIPFKTSFSYECDVEAGEVLQALGGVVHFTKFNELHGSGGRAGAVSAQGIRIGDHRVQIPAGVLSFVALAQSPYLLMSAPEFERAYTGLLVGRHAHLVRFDSRAAGVYQIAALQLKPQHDVTNPDALDWSSAHGAMIHVSQGLIDKIQVSLPLLGSVTILRVP